MNSRRKFVIQGSLATAALLALKPMEILAKVLPTSNNFLSNSNCLTLLHSAEPELMVQSEFMSYVSKANRIASPIVLNASDNTVNNNQIHLHKEAFNSRYSILNQGGVITGFITISADEVNGTQTLNEVATYLKQEKKCNLVVCVSQLGFKNKTGLDDLTLAATSENIDIILGGNTANFTTKTMVVRNNKKEEVIIQSSFSTHLPCGKLEIAFDEAGNKKHIHVATKFYNDTIGALV
jgi:hypothetical protein